MARGQKTTSTVSGLRSIPKPETLKYYAYDPPYSSNSRGCNSVLRNPIAEDRRYDVVVRDPKTGAAGSGVEIKSSEGAMNRNDESAKQQFRADRWINMQREPIVSIGKREGIPIGSTYKIQWQVKERPRLWVP